MLPSAQRTLVTGASRPLGLEVIKQCLERGDRVIATCRNPARVPILADLRAKFGTLDLVALDPADAASVAEAVPVLESITESVDLLIITPGEPGPHERSGEKRDQQLDTISATDLVEHFRRHAVAPLLLVRTLLPMLRAAESAQVVFLTPPPQGASEHNPEVSYSIRASQAALDVLVQALSVDVAEYGVTVASHAAGSDASVTSRSGNEAAVQKSIRALLAGTR